MVGDSWANDVAGAGTPASARSGSIPTRRGRRIRPGVPEIHRARAGRGGRGAAARTGLGAADEPAHRHRSRRHQDRGGRARRRWRASASAAASTRRAATTTERLRRSPIWSPRSSARPGERGTVGVGMPGSISPASGLVKNANSTWLIGHPLQHGSGARAGPAGAARQRRELLRAVGSERRRRRRRARGVRRDPRHRHRRRHRRRRPACSAGPNAIAGEWGHNALPWPDAREWPGPPCYCGRRGCIETFLSGSGLQLRVLGRSAALDRARNRRRGGGRR